MMNNISPSDNHVYFLKEGKTYFILLHGGYFSIFDPKKGGQIIVKENLWHGNIVLFETKDQKELDKKFSDLTTFIQTNIPNLPVKLPDDFFKT